jgi:hypothetical protein
LRTPITQEKQMRPDTDESDDDRDDEFSLMRDELHARITEFAEEHELAIGALSPLLLDLAVTTRVADYTASVANPSTIGLKRELDRMGRDVEQFLRRCKRNADDFIAHARDLIREAGLESEDGAAPDAEDEATPEKPGTPAVPSTT